MFFYDKISQVQRSTKNHHKTLKSRTNLRFINLKFINKRTFYFFYDKISQHQGAPKSPKKHQKVLQCTTTNLRLIDIRFIDTRFIDLKFIDTRFIDST